MAAHNINHSCHVVEGMMGGPVEMQPSVVNGKRGATAAATMDVSTAMSNRSLSSPYNDPMLYVDADVPVTKKAKIHHLGISLACLKSDEVAVAVKHEDTGDGGLGLPSPTDVRNDVDDVGWCSQSKIQSHVPTKNFSQIKTLPPTLRGIADAAIVLHASRQNEAGAGKQSSKNNAAVTTTPPLLLSFPTESVYMLACCVNTTSSRSIRKLLSRADSQTSFISSCCSEKGNLDPCDQNPAAFQGGSLALKEFVHPPNASLEWMLKCSDNSAPGSPGSLGPLLFVLDANHALNFCHFTKPKTFAIRPQDVNKSNSVPSTSVKTLPSSAMIKQNSFGPLPIFGDDKSPNAMPQAPLTPKPTISSDPATPVTPNNHKLCAANFSESREAFLRLASKFWPGPVVFHVQVRTLGGDSVPDMSKKLPSSATSSVASLPSLASTGDLMTAGNNMNPTPSVAGVPVLPESALAPVSQLLPNQDDGPESERYFVGMQCPSHPLPRKILNEIYHGSAWSNRSTVSHSSSCDSFASISSADDNVNGENTSAQQKALPCKNGRARTSIAVVGCMMTGPKSPANNSFMSTNANSTQSPASCTGVTTAAGVDKAMANMMMSIPSRNDSEKKSRVFIVNGEDNRESFSVPTCQYGAPPVSLLIDGDNRTIHLIHHRHDSVSKDPSGTAMKKTLLTKNSVYRALRKPASSTSNGQSFNLSGEKKGDGSSGIDRVITAVLSRWKVQESTIISS